MHEYIASNPQFILNGFMHAGITKALDGDLDSDSEDDVGEHSTQSTSEDSDSEPASGTENVLDTKTVIVEGDAEDMVIEDETAQSTDDNSEPQSGVEELIIIEDTDISD